MGTTIISHEGNHDLNINSLQYSSVEAFISK